MFSRIPARVAKRVLCLAKGHAVILSGAAYSKYSQLASITEVVPLSATWGAGGWVFSSPHHNDG